MKNLYLEVRSRKRVNRSFVSVVGGNTMERRLGMVFPHVENPLKFLRDNPDSEFVSELRAQCLRHNDMTDAKFADVLANGQVIEV